MKIAAIWIVLKSIWSIISKLFFGKDDQRREIKKLKMKMRNVRYEIKEELDCLKTLSAGKRDYTRFDGLLAERQGLCEQIEELQAP